MHVGATGAAHLARAGPVKAALILSEMEELESNDFLTSFRLLTPLKEETPRLPMPLNGPVKTADVKQLIFEPAATDTYQTLHP